MPLGSPGYAYVFSNIKITLYKDNFILQCLHVHMFTCEKVRISDEAERVQSVSYPHIRSLSGLYTVVCSREDKRGTYLGRTKEVYSSLIVLRVTNSDVCLFLHVFGYVVN